MYNVNVFTDRYGDGYSDAYGNSPHSHHGHYDSSPPFQTVPGSGVQTPEHWSPNGVNGVTSTTASGSGANTPVDIQLNSHHLPHPSYLSHHREQYPTHHHTHVSNGDIKPVIPPAMLGGYSGKLTLWNAFVEVFSKMRWKNHVQTDVNCCWCVCRPWQWTMFHWLWTNSIVAISPGALDRQNLPELYFMDGGWMGIQAHGPRWGCQEVGNSQEQAQDELREAESWPALLLRQEHYPQNCGQTLRVSLCVSANKFIYSTSPES